MNISIATDYKTDKGDPLPYLKLAAEHGFTHIHWCHQWCTDFVYSKVEVDEIEKWFKDLNLQLLDLHGSVGPEKNWFSAKEYERKAGVELVINRLEMTAQLGGGSVIMHTGSMANDSQLRKSLDELEPVANKLNVKIAVENGSFNYLSTLFADYSPDFLGLCYDSGHANMEKNGMDRLEELKDRLCSIHLHDNNGTGDEHKIPFSGTVNWMKLADIIARSSYKKCPSLEVGMHNMGIPEAGDFVRLSYEKATVLALMFEDARQRHK